VSELGAGLVIAIEVLIVIAIIVIFVRRKRSGSAKMSSRLIPRIVLRFVIVELEIWVAVWRFIFVRRAPENFYPANRSILGYLVVFTIITAPVELLLVHVLIQSETVVWVVTAVSAYGIFWIFGMYTSTRTMPDEINEHELVLRYRILGEIIVPITSIAAINARTAKSSKSGDGFRSELGEIEAWLMSAGQTDVTIELNSMIRPRGFLKMGSPVRIINVAVDKPDEFEKLVRARSGHKNLREVT
jgi:hypothetical protein